MPNYEYRCAVCKKDHEVWQRITDPALKRCPKCRSTKVQRLISKGSGFILTGGGWYATDYAGK